MGRRTSPGGALAAAKRAEKRQQERDRQTGRYVHVWGVIGSDDRGETAECQDCGQVRWYGRPDGKERKFKEREAARAAGAPFDAGY